MFFKHLASCINPKIRLPTRFTLSDGRHGRRSHGSFGIDHDACPIGTLAFSEAAIEPVKEF